MIIEVNVASLNSRILLLSNSWDAAVQSSTMNLEDILDLLIKTEKAVDVMVAGEKLLLVSDQATMKAMVNDRVITTMDAWETVKEHIIVMNKMINVKKELNIAVY